MLKRNGVELINASFDARKNVCVGLDTDPAQISKEIEEHLREKYGMPSYGSPGVVMRRFNEEIISATCDLVGAYKFNLKFYLAELHQGLWALQESIAFIKKVAPDVLIILDSKDGDVGVSMKKAAEFAFDKLGVDAVTVNPWGGYEDGMDVFFEYKDKMIFVWCRGSNSGSYEIQDIEISTVSMGALCDEPLYELIAENISGFNEYEGQVPEQGWNKNRNCGVVIGAAHSEQLGQTPLERVRFIVGSMPILVPGIGAQNGDLKAAVMAAGPRTLFNSSRGIIYASKGLDFAEAARTEVIRLQKAIDKHKRGE